MPVPKWGIWSQEGGGGRGGARRALCAIGLRAAADRRAGPGTDASSGSAGGGRRRVLNRKCAACSATVPLPAAPRRPSRRARSPAAAAAQDSLRAGFGPIPPPGVSVCARPLETRPRPRPRPAADRAARKPKASGGCARSSTCFAKHRSPRSCPAPRAHSNPPRERCAALGASRVSPSPPPPPPPPHLAFFRFIKVCIVDPRIKPAWKIPSLQTEPDRGRCSGRTLPGFSNQAAILAPQVWASGSSPGWLLARGFQETQQACIVPRNAQDIG
ncbi:translation initiation factor IF-2-like [Trachypithecus francoisi]|uniref:translation initiation factor IF-2-like n=1 Tax=Trachypithecus francoisi TaxID=54180 RepID=UPI00141BABF2|nr:translation initiation factor IF-2-like [Trachypithecus francoisi]